MIEFNTDHILTGPIKQLLTDFALPKFRVYTKEQQDYYNTYGKEARSVIKAVKYNKTGVHTHYVPYIKDNKLQIYVKNEGEYTWEAYSNLIDHYAYGREYLNGTRHLRISNAIYDSYTHEYLGDYLRFKRDYLGIDLMPLYNCFSNRICNALNYSWTTNTGATINFNGLSEDYKIYMLPVKLFKAYTIAIDCSTPIEFCCGIYGKYQDTREKNQNLPKFTYKKIGSMNFSQPILYEELLEIDDLFGEDTVAEIAQNEDDLKLFIKLPANNNSSIVVLEGDYRSYNDTLWTIGGARIQNHTITNYEHFNEDSNFNPITPLQLLRANTGTSYPFADRLVEYLLGNAITPEDEILDNLKRVIKMLDLNKKQVQNKDIDGEVTKLANGVVSTERPVWQNVMRPIFYDYINNYTASNRNDTNHDILGYVDKNVEALYKAYLDEYKPGEVESNSARRYVTLSKINLYTKNGKHTEEN